MNKKRYQQPAVQCAAPWAEMPIAQMNVGSQEHEEQWTKERKDDVDTDKGLDDYGSLW